MYIQKHNYFHNTREVPVQERILSYLLLATFNNIAALIIAAIMKQNNASTSFGQDDTSGIDFE